MQHPVSLLALCHAWHTPGASAAAPDPTHILIEPAARSRLLRSGDGNALFNPSTAWTGNRLSFFCIFQAA